MILVASIAIDPATIAAWLAAGLFVGWTAGKVTQEPSYGGLGDLILGGIGGLAGGLLYGLIRDDAGYWGALLVALGAAASLIAATRTIVALRSE
jgi:uncharacterized membrane protein YeaQ/YmgE (transglycosylase-associated protein family)